MYLETLVSADPAFYGIADQFGLGRNPKSFHDPVLVKCHGHVFRLPEGYIETLLLDGSILTTMAQGSSAAAGRGSEGRRGGDPIQELR